MSADSYLKILKSSAFENYDKLKRTLEDRQGFESEFPLLSETRNLGAEAPV